MREALFKCVKSGKILFCRENDDRSLDFNSFFTESNNVKHILERLESDGMRNYPPKEGYFENFVRTHSLTMMRMK
jgi:hypothetical protein